MAAKKKAKKTVNKKIARILPARNEDDTWHVKNTPVVNNDGAVIMNPAVVPSEKETNQGTVVRPTLDKDTGVLVMKPVEDDK